MADEGTEKKTPGTGVWNIRNLLSAVPIALGIIFIVRGLDGEPAFFAIGAVLFVLSVALFSTGRSGVHAEPTEIESEPKVDPKGEEPKP